MTEIEKLRTAYLESELQATTLASQRVHECVVMSQDRNTERLYDRLLAIEPESTADWEAQCRVYLLYEGAMQPDEECDTELRLAPELLRRALKLLPVDRQ